MSKYFDYFPTVQYDINNLQYTNLEVATNIFFRIRILREILSNFSAYYEYSIIDTDRPDTLAEKVYGSAEAHWIILYANDIIDPLVDWPLNIRDFNTYITSKYGSVENAKTTVHHYEKVIDRMDNLNGIEVTTRFVINGAPVASDMADDSIPYDTYAGLPDHESYNAYNGLYGMDRTIIEKINRNEVMCYDWETEQNENKRNIKIIKPEFYPRIMNEFNTLTKNAANPHLRKLV